MDSLSSHFVDFDKYTTWRDNPDRTDVIYQDKESFSNINLCYFPPNCTAYIQPADQGKKNYRSNFHFLILRLLPSYPKFIQKLAQRSAYIEIDSVKGRNDHKGIQSNGEFTPKSYTLKFQ